MQNDLKSLTLPITNYKPARPLDNSTSRFNPLANIRCIYRNIMKFGASSLIAFFIDSIMYTLLTMILPGIVWIHVIGARLISSTVNFLINRNIIFAKSHHGKLKRNIIGYYILAVILMVSSIGIISLLKNISVNIYISYIVSTVLLLLISFPVQKNFIFK